jgi:chromosome segregation ATPase
MLDPVSILGLTAAGMQMFQQLVQLQNRILAKPDDRKTLRAIRDEARNLISELRKHEKNLTGEEKLECVDGKEPAAEASTEELVRNVKTASMELRDVLQDVVNEIDGLGKRKRITKVLTYLSIYSPRFERRLAAALRTFQLKFSLQNQKQTEDSLAEMTQKLDKLTLTKQQLEEDFPEMNDAIARIDGRITALSKGMDEIRTSQVQFQETMKDYFPEMVSQIREDVRKDGDETRELVQALCTYLSFRSMLIENR